MEIMEKKEIKEPTIVINSKNKIMLKIASTKSIDELVNILGIESAKDIINELLSKYEQFVNNLSKL